MLWEHAGSVFWVFGRSVGLPPNAALTSACTPAEVAPPVIDLVSTKVFLRDLRRDRGDAFLGLLRDVVEEGTVCSAVGEVGAVGPSLGGEVDTLLSEFRDVFEAPGVPPPRSTRHRIDLVDPTRPPPRHRVYRMSARELAEVRKQLDSLLEKGWIRPSASPYGHPVLFARKKDGSLRMCVDYRTLNANTRVDRYPIPRIDELLDRLGSSKFFSSLDL